MEPRVEVWKEAQEVNMYPVWTDYDEMALFMEAKDEVLADLKKGKLSFYTSIGAEKIEVLVNPANEEDVRLVY